MKLYSRLVVILGVVLFTVLAGASTVEAKDAKMAFGVKPAGFSINPEQFCAGVQAVLGSVSKTRFAPSVDFGFGDNRTLITFNFDLKMDLFPLPNSNAQFYAGVGPEVIIISPDGEDQDTEVGLGIVGGLKLPFSEKHYYNLEARFGIGDVPDFTVMIGAMFGFGRMQ